MFKTLTKTAVFILTLSFLLLAGCSGENTRYSVEGGPAAEDTVSSNGGMVVQKGNFVYFINGVSTTSADNAFGTPVKGSIVRMDLTTKAKVIVAPKVVLSSYEKSGLYIFGNKIYYTSPSIEKDKNGNRLSSYLDYYSVNLDGSGTKKFMTTTTNNNAYKFIEKDGVVYLLYIDSTKAEVYLVNAESGAKTVILDKYTNSPVLAEDGYIYYTKAVYKNEEEKETYTYNRLYKISNTGGTAEEIKFADNQTTITQDKFTVTLAEVKIFGGKTVLYYSKKSATDIAEPIIAEGLYCYKAGDDGDSMLLASSANTFDITNRIYISEKVFIGVYTPKSQNEQQAQTGSLYYFDCSLGSIVEADFKLIMENPAKVLSIQEDYIYYLKTVDSKNLLYKIFIGGNFDYNPDGEEVLEEVSFTTSGLACEIIGDYIYFVRSDGDYPNYLYRFDINGTDTEAELVSIIADADKIEE